MKNVRLYLVSDCTGDTLHNVVGASITRFSGIQTEEKIFPLVRSKHQIDEIEEEIKKNPGIVMYTIVDMEIRNYLKEICDRNNIKYIAVLSPVINALSEYLDMETTEEKTGKIMDEDYFRRIEATNFALNHDDGQMIHNLAEANIILIGASRTSKSPTSMYLAYRGYKTANIPLVKGGILPDILQELKGPLIVGLVISPSRLSEVRKNRILSINATKGMNYTDIEYIEDEIKESRKIFSKFNWPVIDVTRRSVEETAANIIQLFQKHNELNR